ncbi:MAG TPA: hypothetical protein VLX33_00515 [Nitrososphaerales archaeon]|nr:hypothetical protein [Nitrososphaerales archaeon]
MVELVEYALVVMVSTLFVGGSVLVYGEFTTFESGISLRAAFDGVSALASKAIVNGSATATLPVPSSTITCQGQTLSMTVGGSSLDEVLPLGCSFAVSVPAGVHTLKFCNDSSRLDLSVS